MSADAVQRREVAGWDSCVLQDSSSAMEATFVPAAGMLGASLRHRGEELLAQVDGVDGYVRDGTTMGIPFLHPWANRLDGFSYSGYAGEVMLYPDQPGLRLEQNGLPIHGLMGGFPGWLVERLERRPDGAVLEAVVDFGAYEELLRAFPFPHVVRMAATLGGGRLEVRTTLEATGELAVPVAFGFHPYVQLPGAPRSQWLVEMPSREHLLLDERGLPTGAAQAEPAFAAPLGELTLDDHYVVGERPTTFSAAANGRRVDVRFDEGYPYAQVWAPPGAEFVCFEPMTATVSALSTPGACRLVPPGERFSATFSIGVGEG